MNQHLKIVSLGPHSTNSTRVVRKDYCVYLDFLHQINSYFSHLSFTKFFICLEAFDNFTARRDLYH